MKWGILATGTMTLEVEGKEPEIIRCPVDINGFEYEIREASRCVKLGRTGSNRYTPQDSLALTRLMYDTRMSWGMKFTGVLQHQLPAKHFHICHLLYES